MRLQTLFFVIALSVAPKTLAQTPRPSDDARPGIEQASRTNPETDGEARPVVEQASESDDSLRSGIVQVPGGSGEVTESADVAADEQRMLGMLALNLVVDETQTRIGRDFYEVFFSLWEFPTGAAQHQTVTVQELPVPGLGTRVMVLVDGETAYEAQIQPRLDVIEATAYQAVGFAYRFIQQRTNTRILYP